MRSWGLILGLVVIVVLTERVSAAEPEFEGQPASWWATELDFKPNGLSTQDAIVRLSRGGADAVPVLIEVLTREGGNGSPLNAEHILIGLAVHDGKSAPALIKHLAPLLADSEHSTRVSWILKVLAVAHPERHSALRAALLEVLPKARESFEGWNVSTLLAAISVDSEEGIRRLVGLVLSGEADLSGMDALKKKGREVIPIVVELLPTVKEDFYLLQSLLVGLELPARELFAALLPVAHDPDSKPAAVVRFALIEKAAAEGVTFEQRRELFGTFPGTACTLLIPKMKTDAESVPEFAEFAAKVLADESVKDPVRIGFLNLVPHMKSERARVLLTYVLAGLQHANPEVRQASAEATAAIGLAAAKALPLLVAGLHDKADQGVSRSLRLLPIAVSPDPAVQGSPNSRAVFRLPLH